MLRWLVNRTFLDRRSFAASKLEQVFYPLILPEHAVAGSPSNQVTKLSAQSEAFCTWDLALSSSFPSPKAFFGLMPN
jgi:hypothetical protein